MDTVNEVRPFSGWVRRAVVNRQLEQTKSRLPLDEEYWLALRHPAEVATVGHALLGINNPSFAAFSVAEKEASWREFRAYVRQAEGFYRGASVLPWKSSPLNYYYSFLNLAKAMAVAHGLLPPQTAPHPRRVRHGLSATVDSGLPDVWRLTVQRPTEMFPQLYQMAIGRTVPEHTELDARQLLNYVSPITWQLDKSGYGPGGWYPSYWVTVTTETESWDVLVVPRGAPLDRLPATFDADYQEIASAAAKGFAMRVLQLHAIQASAFRFLQRIVPIPTGGPEVIDGGAIERALKAAAPACVFESMDGTYDLALSLPYRAGTLDVPMNEFMACYAVMYFLSSLVRYHPDYMDAIGESSDAWLIESFAKSAPLHLLRYMVAGVLGYTLIITSA